MFEERLETTLTGMGYQRMNSNAPGIYLYYFRQGEELRIISILRVPNGTEVTKEQYYNLLKQIKNNFLSNYPYRMALLSLILTEAPDQAKHLCIENSQDNHWMVDVPANRLIIYENQTGEFAGLRGAIEAILEEEYLRRQRQEPPAEEWLNLDEAQGTSQPSRNKGKLFAPVNAILIIINVLAYLLTHYTPAFGGPDAMLSGGALAWYEVFVNKQYYRILTAMFMHGDFSHLLNNMLVLFFIGDNLERAAGKLKYLLIYFGTGIIAGITSISYNMWMDSKQIGEASTYSIGASGAIFGVVGAVLFIVMINRGRLEGISTRQMVFFVILSLYGGIANTHIDQAAHIGGFITGIILAALLYRKHKDIKVAEQRL